MAIYILGHLSPEEHEGFGLNPLETEKRATGEEMTIEYKYCCNTLGLTKDTFEEAITVDHYKKGRVLDQHPLRLL